MKHLLIILLLCVSCVGPALAQEPRTEITKWQDGKPASMKSTVKTKQAGQAIEVTVSHSLDPKVYDLPLTARTTVPAQWTSAQFRQGPVTDTLPVQHEGVSAYVQYRIAPNGVVARLERGQ